MNKLLVLTLASFLIFLSACEKNPVCEEPASPLPTMRYTDLQNFEIKYGTYKRVDVDGDGKTDFYFETLLLGDALGQRDRLQFYADSKIDTYLPVNESEEVPRLSSGDWVKVEHPGHTWYEISAIVLAEKVMPLNGDNYWDGMWKGAAHKFLPIMIKKGELRYYGWIELSFDTTAEKMILHRAAISLEANKEVKAGY
jgi:hypothetical protein